MKQRQYILLAMRILGTLLSVLMVGATFPTGVTAASSTMVVANCLGEMHLTVTDFTGTPNGVQGTIDYSWCLSPTQPQITHGEVQVNGSATGTQDNLTIAESDDITWLDADGHTVAKSFATLTRRMVGIGLLTTMVEAGEGIVVNGLFANHHVTVLAGLAIRSQSKNGWLYTNQSDNGCDYG